MPVPEPPSEPVGGSGPTERFDTLASGTEPARPSARRGVLTAALVVLALGAAGLTGVALARSGGSSDPQTAVAASTSTPTPSGNANAPWRDGRRGMGRGLLGLAGALHGELVVPDGSGGYRTVVVQRGKASNVGSSSLTVTSDDGWSRTYAVPAGARVGALREGLGSIKNDDQVVVVAEQKGGTLTADHVMDLSSIQQGLDGWLGGGPGRMGGAGGMGGPGGMGQGTGYGV